jgi:hypothetical protein
MPALKPPIDPDARLGRAERRACTQRNGNAPLLGIAARLLPGWAIWNGTGPAGTIRQAGDQGFRWGGGEGI